MGEMALGSHMTNSIYRRSDLEKYEQIRDVKMGEMLTHFVVSAESGLVLGIEDHWIVFIYFVQKD